MAVRHRNLEAYSHLFPVNTASAVADNAATAAVPPTMAPSTDGRVLASCFVPFPALVCAAAVKIVAAGTRGTTSVNYLETVKLVAGGVVVSSLAVLLFTADTVGATGTPIIPAAGAVLYCTPRLGILIPEFSEVTLVWNKSGTKGNATSATLQFGGLFFHKQPKVGSPLTDF